MSLLIIPTNSQIGSTANVPGAEKKRSRDCPFYKNAETKRRRTEDIFCTPYCFGVPHDKNGKITLLGKLDNKLHHEKNEQIHPYKVKVRVASTLFYHYLTPSTS